MNMHAVITVNKETKFPTITNIVTSKYVADRKAELLKEQHPNYLVTVQSLDMEVQFT